MTDSADLARWAAAVRPGFGLPRDSYLDPALYQAEQTLIWEAAWLFAGHSCEAAAPGDYFVVAVEAAEVIIARTEAGAVAAFHNVCRHRGSQLVTAPAGHTRRFVCPYHQWTYGLEGALHTCRDMPAELDKAGLGLRPVAAREVEGLIFISLAAAPPPFEAAAAHLAPRLRPQGLRQARVAHTAEYAVAANWKIVWENNRECYHCDACHPQYIQANYDRYEAEALTPAAAEQLAAAEARWAAWGLPVHGGLYRFPDPEGHVWYSANRTALAEGFVTESLDGQPVAPVMGDYPSVEVGTLRVRTLPNFWMHASGDHAVTTRLLPAGPRGTRIRVTWLVAADAQPGRDYTLERLLPFWQLTAEQDWALCARVQRGVESPAYLPGPLSPSREYNVEAFLRWYARRLAPAKD